MTRKDLLPGSASLGCFGGRHRWRCFTGLLLFEMALAALLPDDVLTLFPSLDRIVTELQAYIPSIAAFDKAEFPGNGATRLFMSIALLLVPLKVFLFYDWMADVRSGVSKHLVVTLTSDTKPADGSGFVSDPLYEDMGAKRPTKPRSMFSRIFWSLLILGMTAVWWFMVHSVFDMDDYSGIDSRSRGFRSLAYRRWFESWYEWSIASLSFTAFFTTSSIFVLKGYWQYAASLITRLSRRYTTGVK